MREDFVDPLWDAPLDAPTALSLIPDTATIAGMFFQPICEASKARNTPFKGLRDRYTRFKFYPQREFAELLLECAAAFYEGVPLRQALRQMGRTAPHAMIESMMGKVIFGSAHGVPEIVEAMAKTYPINVRPSEVETLEKSDRHVIVRMHNVCYFLDCHHVGVFEGTMHYAGIEGTVKIRSRSPVSADLLCEW